MSTALVWFKRDLRWRDHAPLAAARACDSAAAIYIIEPTWLQSPECHSSQVDYTLICLSELRRDLAARGLPLLVRVGEVPQVLSDLRRDFPFSHLFSHEETGTGWSYTRDKNVATWCQTNQVVWQEFAQTGVVRRLRTRNGWAARWAARMNAAQAHNTDAGWSGAPLPQPDLPTLADLGLPGHSRALPATGEAAAWTDLNDFLQGRARGYGRALSSPLSAESGCSRLSAHLAFGSISMRAVHQATEATIARCQSSESERSLAYALRGFAGRLRWHCHFMQKLEDQPDIEWRNVARVYDGLRPGDASGKGPVISATDQHHFEAWCAGRTGFPMVDACMRYLCATGWLNFRMRAMLVSFASYHLWLHWRETGLFLARQFLDFEPGIHWSQMQMQSGTTGINTLRIYSPSKQALDQDPRGEFVRRWVPELYTPAYPAPIVDERVALKRAKDRMYGERATPAARAEAEAVQERHGSRKSGLPQQQRPSKQGRKQGRKRTPPDAAIEDTASTQGELF